jgi:hypothetical protein
MARTSQLPTALIKVVNQDGIKMLKLKNDAASDPSFTQRGAHKTAGST